MNLKYTNPGLKLSPDSADLLKLAETRMPFGKYAGPALLTCRSPMWSGFHGTASLKGSLEGC